MCEFKYVVYYVNPLEKQLFKNSLVLNDYSLKYLSINEYIKNNYYYIEENGKPTVAKWKYEEITNILPNLLRIELEYYCKYHETFKYYIEDSDDININAFRYNGLIFTNSESDYALLSLMNKKMKLSKNLVLAFNKKYSDYFQDK